MNRLILIIGILTSFICCKSTDISNESDFTIKNDSINLFAFIGQKISITEFDPNENNERIEIDSLTGVTIRRVSYVMDNGFKNKYKVIKNVFNDLKRDTIEFVAYDHYGRPGFENYENVILYVSLNKEKGNYYQQKYQFDPVEKTKNGKWKGLKVELEGNLLTFSKEGEKLVYRKIENEPMLLSDLVEKGTISQSMYDAARYKRIEKWREETGHVTKFK